MLLLDGFDEVVPSLRGHIASEILRLRRDYPKCRCIVTCRTASYSNEFSEFDETYHLVEFTDQQIRRFLTCWDLPPGTSPDHLLASLRDRPRILELAKNPLLLTMIAWLHFDEKTHLPDRRSQFYLQATELLLRRWEEATHKGNPQFRSEVKRKILQRLALLAQDSSVEEGVDRRIIKYQRLCGTAEKVLNEEGHEGRDLRPILQEIVERSGLLLSFDGGERYQFAHLTLQEYFASECLSDDWKGVLERVARDPDTWRETAKLWVGRAENPAGFLEELAKTDALLALECLAEASQVPELVGDRLIVALKPQLQNSAEAERVARVFGLAASSRTPFGNRVLDLLLNEFSNARDDSARRRLALSLSSTNLPEAAAVLAGAYRQHKSETREFLVRLGDLAVNELARLAETGESDALDDLLSIGTPKAALCLAKMIGDRLDSLAQAASWRLAGLTFLPEIERCLRPPLPKELQALQAQPCLAWPWQPFERFVEIDASVPRRIAHLMNISSPDHVPQSPLRLDPRIVVPLCLELSQSELDSTVLGPSADLAEEVSEKIPDSPGLGPRLRVLLSSLDRELRKEVFGVLRRGKVSGHTPHRDDWAAYSGPASFDLWRSWQYRLLFVGACLASAASFIESGRLILELLTQGAIWQGTLLLIACWVFAISCFYLLRAHFTARARGVLALLGGPVWPLACKQARPRYRVSRIDALLGYCISSAWFVFSTLFVTRCVSRYVGDGWLLIGAWFLPFNCALPLAGRALYLDQKARNPLQRIFALLRPNARR